MEKSEGRWFNNGKWRRPAGWLLAAAVLLVVAYYGVQALLVDTSAPVRLVVYAFSTQEEALTQGVFPAFEQQWEKSTGQPLTIEGVFGASGTLAGQINLGAPADIAIFSNAEHVDWLKMGKRVPRQAEPVIVGCTPMIIATRPGNPFQVTAYAHLARPGLSLLHADPNSSGAGEWAVLAEYGSALFESSDVAVAETQLRDIWRNVQVLAPSARAMMSLFELGAGDALVTYEQDALLALERGVKLEIVLPPRSIAAQHAAILVDDNVSRTERPVAEAFLDYLSSEAGREVLNRYYLRPPDCQGDAFASLVEPFTVEALGGWSKAYTELVEGLWQNEIEPGLHLEPAPRLPSTGESQ
jgi:sulfate transport system substrate-binding protein